MCKRVCGDLNEIHTLTHRLEYLNTQSPVGDPVQRGLGGAVLGKCVTEHLVPLPVRSLCFVFAFDNVSYQFPVSAATPASRCYGS